MKRSVTDQRIKLLEKASPELRLEIEWFLDWFQNESRHSLMARWVLGNEVKNVYAEMERPGGKYAPGAMKTILAFIPEDRSMLQVAHKLAVCYPDRKQIDEICEMRMKDGMTSISYSHMRVLITIPDEEKRKEALNLTLVHSWTSSQLGEHVKKLVGYTRSKNPSGVAKPKDVQAVINQQMSFTDDFENRNIKVWKHPQNGLSGQLARLEPDQYTEDLAKQIGQLAHRLRQLATEAASRADEAEKKFEEITRTLKLGQAAAGSTERVSGAAEAQETPERPVGKRRSKVAVS